MDPESSTRAGTETGARSSVHFVRRTWKAALVTVLGCGGAFLLMANDRHVRHGALLGTVCLLLGIAGLLRALGLLAAREGAASLSQTPFHALPGEPAWASPRVSAPVAVVALFAVCLTFGAAGLPYAIAAALLLLLPAALRRPGLLVFVVASALYLPLLGTFGAWDPWETHYGEVSREMLSRDDWISLWWAQDRWFWSKPIFIFWAEALLWSASGIAYLPDSNFEHAEWVLRLPTYLISVSALLAVYATISRFWSRRAALLAALVLATMPYHALLTRQAITDMPFVGSMTVAVMLLLLAVHEDPEREVRSYRIGSFSVSAQEIVIGAFLLLALPQVLYLASRNITFVAAEGLFAWHPDEFTSGSGHNPDVPGNVGLRDERPRFGQPWFQPLAQALYWGAGIALVVRFLRRERRAQALYMVAFYLLCALSFMAKGLPGFALPGLIALLYLWSCKRWSLLLEGRLRVALGALVLVIVGLPWFVAMYMRHGSGFTNRLLIHDHINRLAKGVHGDNGSIEYFIEQLGYGTFPWIGLAPLALGSFLLYARGNGESARKQRETAVLIGLWFAAAFTLFSAMITKFHHYVLPAVPPAAILIGGLLDRMLGPSLPEHERARGLRAIGFALFAPLPLVLGVAGLRGDVRGVLPVGLPSSQQAVWVLQHPWPAPLCAALIAVGLACVGVSVMLQLQARGGAVQAAPDERALGAGLIAGALLCAFVGRDLSWTTAKRPAGHERLIDLFVYNYDRPWPTHFDYRPILSGFAVVATLLVALAAVRVLRPVLTHAIVGLALAFTLFSLDVYMLDLTPHWSQRGLVKRYYEERKSAKDPLVAWQMNWKGENFYSGNRVAVFVELNNKEITSWIDENAGKTAFFMLEHSRLGRFKTLVGSKRSVEELTTVRDNNKFVLVKVRL